MTMCLITVCTLDFARRAKKREAGKAFFHAPENCG
jgi:hypothetical protein